MGASQSGRILLAVWEAKKETSHETHETDPYEKHPKFLQLPPWYPMVDRVQVAFDTGSPNKVAATTPLQTAFICSTKV